jgi:hypothetical protein
MRKKIRKGATHPEQQLICPKCVSSQGGTTTSERYSKTQQSAWGKMGGRPRNPEVPTEVVWIRPDEPEPDEPDGSE